MKNNFKRAASLFSAMILTVTAITSCGEKSEINKEPVTADKLLRNSYSPVAVDVPGDLNNIWQMGYAGDTIYYIGSDKEYKPVMYKSDIELTEFTKIDMTINAEGKSFPTYDFRDDGTFIVLERTDDYGDAVAPDYNDPDFNWEAFSWEDYEQNRTTTYNILEFGQDGQIKETVQLDELTTDGKSGLTADVSGAYAVGDNYLLKVYSWDNGGGGGFVRSDRAVSFGGKDGDGFMLFDKSGKLVKEVDMKDAINYIQGIGRTSDGVAILYNKSDDYNKYILSAFDGEKKAFTDGIEIPVPNGKYFKGTMSKGNGEYYCLLTTNKGLEGYNPETNELTEIINWQDSDLNGDNINIALALPNDDYLVSQYDWDGSQGGVLFRLTRRDMSELEKTVVITMATLYTDSTISNAISAFNKENNGYRIKTVDYSEYNNDDNKWRGASQKLSDDIMSGKCPDIVMTGNFSEVAYTLAAKGAFADLYTLMDKDPDINRNTIVPSILKASEVNGKLYDLPISFAIDTIIAKTKNVKSSENWTYEDMFNEYASMPSGMTFMAYEPFNKDVLSRWIAPNINDFMNPKTGACKFDSPEFIKLLEFAAKFPMDEANYDDPNFDWEAYSEKMQPIWNDQQTAFIRDKALTQNEYISSFRGYHTSMAGAYKNEDITFVGYPSNGGSGALLSSWQKFAITAKSPSKEVAWKFLRQFYLEEFQSNENTVYEFPVNIKAMEKKIEREMKPASWTDLNTGEVNTWDTTYWDPVTEKEIKIGEATREECDKLLNYINSATKFQYYDYEFFEIITDETAALWAGDKTAEQVAKAIQDRASIYISERS